MNPFAVKVRFPGRFFLSIALSTGLISAAFANEEIFDLGLAQSKARGYCRTLIKLVVDPLDSVVKGYHLIRRPGIGTAFSVDLYQREIRSIAMNPSGLSEPSLPTVEAFLARVDHIFEARGYPLSFSRSLAAGDPVRAKNFLRDLKAILEQEPTFTQRLSGGSAELTDDRLTQLSKLYYAITRKLPYHSVESLLRAPGKSVDRVVNYQIERLFLNHAFREVFGYFGLHMAVRSKRVRNSIQNAAFTAFMIPAKVMGVAEAETTLRGLVFNNDFYNDIYELGFLAAANKNKEKLSKVLRPRARFEVYVAAAGGLFAIYSMWKLLEEINRPAPLLPGQLPDEVSSEVNALDPAEIRERLIESWKAKEEKTLGMTFAADDPDYLNIKEYYETLDVETLRKTYEGAY